MLKKKKKKKRARKAREGKQSEIIHCFQIKQESVRERRKEHDRTRNRQFNLFYSGLRRDRKTVRWLNVREREEGVRKKNMHLYVSAHLERQTRWRWAVWICVARSNKWRKKSSAP